MAKKKGKQNNRPKLGQFLNTRAAEVRDSAANAILKQKLPNVPEIPRYKDLEGFPSRLAGKLGMSDETRIKLFGYEPEPWTCLYTATSQYGDKNAKVAGNETFKKDPSKYGFISIPMEEAAKGDLFQFTKSEEEPGHSAIYTDTDDEGGILVSYSRGGIGEQSLTEAGIRPTMAKNEPLKHVSDNEGTPTAFRYVGTPEKKIEWIHQYKDKFNANPFEEFAPNITHVEKADATRVNKPLIIKENGGFLERKEWNSLSMAERAEIMKLAVEDGIYNLDTIRNGYNEYAKGGKIHIKPENRGKFTALKRRTGHSASWFKEHGTPAQKKMAVFAINAAKWKH